MIDDSGYLLGLLRESASDAHTWAHTHQCPSCARLDGRNEERYSMTVRDILRGVRTHCIICGREDDALAFMPAEKVLVAEYYD